MREKNLLFFGMGRLGFAIAGEMKDRAKIYYHDAYSELQRYTPLEKLEEQGDLEKIDMILLTFSAITSEEREKYMEELDNTYDIRLKELGPNISELEDLLPTLRDFPEDTPIVVLTNPTDEVATYLVKKLGRKNIYGYGAELDRLRLEGELDREIPHVVGLHGKAMPVLGKDMDFYKDLYERADRKLLEKIKKNGIPNKKVGIEVSHFLEKFFSSRENPYHLGIFSKKHDVVFSQPCKLQNEGVKRDMPDLNSDEKEFLEECAEEVQEHVSEYT